MLTSSRQIRWEGDLGRGQGAVLLDNFADSLSATWRWSIATKMAPGRAGVNRGEAGEYFGSFGSGAQGAATNLKYTMPVHLVSYLFFVYNRKRTIKKT